MELIGNVVRSACNQPDFVDDDDLEEIISLLEMVSDADIYSHHVLD